MRDQIQRSAVSIPSNITEGFERVSNKEFIRFLYIAKGSSDEIQTQLYIAYKLGYISKNDYFEFENDYKRISVMIIKLVKTISVKMKNQVTSYK